MKTNEAYERQKARQREKYKNDPAERERQKNYHMAYYSTIKQHPDRLKKEIERRRRYYVKHKEIIKQRAKEWYYSHKKSNSEKTVNDD